MRGGLDGFFVSDTEASFPEGGRHIHYDATVQLCALQRSIFKQSRHQRDRRKGGGPQTARKYQYIRPEEGVDSERE